MSDLDYNSSRFPKLIEGNYEQWRILMESTLIAGDLWEVVGPEALELVPKGVKAVKAQAKKMEQARAKIVLNIDLGQLSFISGLENPRDIWLALEGVHRSASVNSVLSLRRRFLRMTMRESESIMTWISRVRTAAGELSHTPCPVSDIDIILVITDGLPPTFATVVSALDNLPLTELTIPNVVNRIYGRAAQIARESEKVSEAEHTSALAARGSGGGQEVTCFRCGGRGHLSKVCPSTPGSTSQTHARSADDGSWGEGETQVFSAVAGGGDFYSF